MHISEWIAIVVFVVGLFFINRFLNKRYLSKTDPDKLEGVKLIMFAFLLGVFYTKVLDTNGGLGFMIALVVLTAHFIYRSYRWLKGVWYHREQER